MELSEFYCPNPDCPDYGVRGLGNIACYETYGKHSLRLLRCRSCKKRFSERRDTLFWGAHIHEEDIVRVVRCLAEGNSIRATARILGFNKNTVFRIFDVAGRHCERILQGLLKDLHMEECQLDELWSFIKKRRKILHLLNGS